MHRLLARLGADRSGAAAMIFVGTLVVTMGMAAFVIDVGAVRVAQRELQASSDAAALAGASEILSGNAMAQAASYSAGSGGANQVRSDGARISVGYPVLKCLAGTGVPCGGPANANAIAVRQQAVVPMIFGRILGLDHWEITALATAGLAGGKAKPLEIMFLMDATASMNDANRSCSVSNSTKLTCALAGGRALINSLAPSANRVGLMAFPGAASASEARKNYDCSTSKPKITPYKNNPVYEILPLGNDFRQDDDSAGLNTNSNIVKAFQGGAPNCKQGMAAPGGAGTYYADAITAAQAKLASTGRADVQRVIVLLSDGDANASRANMTQPKLANQCRQAITAAAAAKAAGTVIYSIAYGASTSSSNSCSTDTTNRISACETMRQIASEASTFYVGNNGSNTGCSSASNSVSDMVDVFESIGTSFQSTRLLPNSMT